MKRSHLTQEQKLAQALKGLEALKKKIIELRFGLSSSKPLTTKEVAKILTRVASPEIILKFASHHKHDDGSVSFSEKDVAILEAEALRELARPGSSHSTVEQTLLTLNDNDTAESDARPKKSLNGAKSSSNKSAALISREGDSQEFSLISNDAAKATARSRSVSKSTKSRVPTRKLRRVA